MKLELLYGDAMPEEKLGFRKHRSFETLGCHGVF